MRSKSLETTVCMWLATVLFYLETSKSPSHHGPSRLGLVIRWFRGELPFREFLRFRRPAVCSCVSRRLCVIAAPSSAVGTNPRAGNCRELLSVASTRGGPAGSRGTAVSIISSFWHCSASGSGRTTSQIRNGSGASGSSERSWWLALPAASAWSSLEFEKKASASAGAPTAPCGGNGSYHIQKLGAFPNHGRVPVLPPSSTAFIWFTPCPRADTQRWLK
eukprot:SAG11_NODE_1463_length_4863_cov_15.348657_4_plen_219_part_00